MKSATTKPKSKAMKVILEIAKMRKISRYELCKMLNIKYATLYDRLNNKNIQLNTAQKMLDVLDCKLVVVAKDAEVKGGIEI